MIAQLVEEEGEKTNFTQMLYELLLYLGLRHPESVLFSLNFAVKSKVAERVRPALKIL
jgi:hypothetical protein